MLPLFISQVHGLSAPAFGDSSLIQPPSLPEVSASTLQPSIVYLELREYETKELIADIHVSLTIHNLQSNESYTTLKYVNQSGLLKLTLPTSQYVMKLEVDDISTPGKDYVLEQDFDVRSEQSFTLFLYPVGSIRGSVSDAEGNVIEDALIKFSCVSSYGDFSGRKTDSFGTFSALWLPVGQCKLYATSNENVGSALVDVIKGSIQDVDIKLKQKVIGTSSYFAWYFAGLVVILMVAFIIIVLYPKRKPITSMNQSTGMYPNQILPSTPALSSSSSSPPFKQTQSFGQPDRDQNEQYSPSRMGSGASQPVLDSSIGQGAPLQSSRILDILPTLSDKERDIVEYLLHNGYTCTQSTLKYKLGIPKTSLVRILQSLEIKKIIYIEKVGKLRKIEITKWFMGKN